MFLVFYLRIIIRVQLHTIKLNYILIKYKTTTYSYYISVNKFIVVEKYILITSACSDFTNPGYVV